MPERYNGEDRDNDGLADYFTPLNYRPFRQAPDLDPIHPAKWRVDLAAESCPSDGAVRWLVDNQDAGGGCNTQVFLTEAPHSISVVYNAVVGEPEIVSPKDWLIAVIGDSYGSGEGNPDVPLKRRNLRRDKPSRWEDKQCHRSATAGAAQAAASIEKADEHSSVTLLHLSCSGARIDVGLLGSYAGAAPDANKKQVKKPQLKELQELLGDRTPDAVLISIGGNDIGFSTIVMECLVRHGCHDPGKKARKTFEAGIKKLPGLYVRLAKALDRMGIRHSHVFVTGYPDPTRYDDGEICGTTRKQPKLLRGAKGVPSAREISPREARWASETVLATLNRELGASARRQGWNFVDAHIAPSRRHGECAKNPWFVRWDESKTRQETIRILKTVRIVGAVLGRTPGLKRVRYSPGVLHPNELGHVAYRETILRDLKNLGMPTG